MFKFLRKHQDTLLKHHYKNLSIILPSHWIFELEEGDLQACYDPKSESTLHINILIATPQQKAIDSVDSLTGDLPYYTTTQGCLLTSPTYEETTEKGRSITLVTWRLINDKPIHKIIALFTYTLLSEEKDSEWEKQTISRIENSLTSAELV